MLSIFLFNSSTIFEMGYSFTPTGLFIKRVDSRCFNTQAKKGRCVTNYLIIVQVEEEFACQLDLVRYNN